MVVGRALGPPFASNTRFPIHHRHLAPFLPHTLATLTVSRRPGYRGVASAQSVATPAHFAGPSSPSRVGHPFSLIPFLRGTGLIRHDPHSSHARLPRTLDNITRRKSLGLFRLSKDPCGTSDYLRRIRDVQRTGRASQFEPLSSFRCGYARDPSMTALWRNPTACGPGARPPPKREPMPERMEWQRTAPSRDN